MKYAKNNGEEKIRMHPNEIRELMKQKGWTTTELAYRLDLTANAVAVWLTRDKPIKGPASILMRQWLEEEEPKSRKSKDMATAS